MEIITGGLYHIKDEYFKKVNHEKLMINHDNGHSRPSYLAIKDKELLWFIPLSSKVDKYRKIINDKIKKYGKCKGILIERIANKEEVILIQNAFPTLEKYIQSRHSVDGKYIVASTYVKRKILSSFNTMMLLKERGLNLFFTDIDKIKDIMFDEITEKV